MIDGIQCHGRTDKLVCDYCYPEKDKLYSTYKEKEKTVISALSSPPRGNLLEVTKVVGRLSALISLRQQFTKRLCHQVRDIGHQYHLSKLMRVVESYREYQTSALNNFYEDYEEDEVNEETTKIVEAITESHVNILKQLNKIIELDPFTDFDIDTKAYKAQLDNEQKSISSLKERFNISDMQLELVISFYSHIYWCVEAFKSLFAQILRNRVVFVPFKPYGMLRDKLEMINSMLQADIAPLAGIINWVIQYYSKCRFVILSYQGNAIMIMQSQEHIHNYIVKFTVRVLDGQLMTIPRQLCSDEFDIEEIRFIINSRGGAIFTRRGRYS